MRPQSMASIAVNTRLLLPGKLGGIGWFAHQALSRMVQAHPEHTFHFLFDRAFDQQFVYASNVEPHVVHPQARHPVLYKWWFDFSIPRKLKQLDADVFLSPDGYLSLRTNVKQLPVIHDLNFEAYPEDLPKWESKYYRSHFPKFARKGARVVTVSEFSKGDIAERYGVNPDRIDVVYNGVNDSFRPLAEPEKQAFRDAWTDGQPYFVYVGAQTPRKNLQGLFAAFDRYCASDAPEAKLLIVGEKMFWNRTMTAAWERFANKDRVVITGRLDAEKLNAAVASAHAMTFVSYYEGFGIPILEAFAAGTPLLIANATALPEIAGDAALQADPFDPEALAQQMVRLMTDETLRGELVKKGLQRVADFSWDRTAEGLWRSVSQLLPG